MQVLSLITDHLIRIARLRNVLLTFQPLKLVQESYYAICRADVNWKKGREQRAVTFTGKAVDWTRFT